MTDLISDERLAEIRERLSAICQAPEDHWPSYSFDAPDVLALLARLDKAEELMLDLRAFVVANADDLSMHSKAVALSDRVNAHFAKTPETKS